MYYDYDKISSYNATFNMIITNRGFGKRTDNSNFNFIFNKPGSFKSYEDNNGGYEQIITYSGDIGYLNETMENGVIPLYY